MAWGSSTNGAVSSVLRSPPAQTLMFLAGLGLAMLVLGIGEGPELKQPPLPVEWLIWKGAAALAIAAAIALAARGLRQVLAEKEAQKLTGWLVAS